MSDVAMSDRYSSTASSDTTLPDAGGSDPARPIKLALVVAAVAAVGLLAYNVLAFLV